MFGRPRNILLLVPLLAIVFFSCRGHEGAGSSKENSESKNWNWKSAETEYELLQAEIRLAKTGKPYLVIDPLNKELCIRLKGTTVWGLPMNISSADDGDLNNFVESFMEPKHQYIRAVSDKHLFAASKANSDSVLEIVGKAVNIDPSLMQRIVPQRFQILWGRGLVLDIRTDVAGIPTSFFNNTMADLRRTLQRPFGEAQLVVKMTPEEALTLYRISEPGLPTLVIPPH